MARSAATGRSLRRRGEVADQLRVQVLNNAAEGIDSPQGMSLEKSVSKAARKNERSKSPILENVGGQSYHRQDKTDNNQGRRGY